MLLREFGFPPKWGGGVVNIVLVLGYGGSFILREAPKVKCLHFNHVCTFFNLRAIQKIVDL